jgi:hypothetical protein
MYLREGFYKKMSQKYYNNTIFIFQIYYKNRINIVILVKYTKIWLLCGSFSLGLMKLQRWALTLQIILSKVHNL